jgi:hypothetical protein
MENGRKYTTEELFDPDVDVKNENLTRPSWMYPDERWRVFSPIVMKSKTYSEFKMKCELTGYTGYFTNFDRENGLKIYDVFILSEACYYSEERHYVYRKILMFRDQFNALRFKLKNRLESYM